MFNQAISGTDPPKTLSSDNDPLFKSHRWLANLRLLDVNEIKSIPYAPMSHPFIERVIGTIRREYLGHVPFWNSVDLERKLCEFKDYYNNHRTHESLSGPPWQHKYQFAMHRLQSMLDAEGEPKTEQPRLRSAAFLHRLVVVQICSSEGTAQSLAFTYAIYFACCNRPQ